MARIRTKRKPRGRAAAVFTENTAIPFTKRSAESFASKALSALGWKGGEINILFTDDAGIKRLNSGFKGRNCATDVLAFDTGDIAVSVDTARKNARLYGNTLPGELRLCVVHGILHLCGFDDTSAPKRKVMRDMEKRILGKL
ncbi:MAG TPA: rRNA maturation RNase YbeY [Candidatus Omnitrophota bacterium]|jgi:probable rRNA maturation factor|nr:rRNA maturation RNase YbeY [Candidatus Omnitrophota bacterium]HOX09282.1 rRNA maturation RNase YbeY [Candidatus Omnitrophota bacterium]HPN66911.1 rRNA maturation RNase YbeY [Candidatus Omnitrophota bacterium]HRZ66847.1 rRNA maturation RNase YbeY [Candidatus Omnitrophota bacterium]